MPGHFYSKHFFTLLTITFIAVFSLFFFVNSANAAYGINRQINFQGKLVTNPGATNVSNTSYTVVFTFYDQASGGTALWTETQTVTTTDGIFHVALGSVNPFPSSFNFNWSGLYLGIKVNTDPEMTPRIQMASVPFAFNSQQVAGLTVQDTSGNASTSGTLQVANNVTVKLPSSGTGLIYADTGTTGNLSVFTNSTSQTGSVVGLNLTLSGATSNYNQYGIQFNLSGTTTGNQLDLYGTGGNWNISSAGILTSKGITLSSGAITLGGSTGTGTQCLLGGATASWGSCGSSTGVNWWNELNGALSPVNITDDFLLGSTSTSSALLSFTGVKTGQTIASASGNLILMPNNGWGGQVGIGTTTPASGYILDTRGHGIFGNQQASDITASTDKILYANEKTTDIGQSVYTMAGSLEVNPGATSSQLYYGGLYAVQTSSGNAQNLTGRLVGFQGQVDHFGTGILTQGRGFAGFVINDSTGSITNAYGGLFATQNKSTGSITNSYNLYVNNLGNTGGGTFNTNYGLYVTDQSVVNAVVGSYNIWSDGFNSLNYFGGLVGIGATPSASLHVAGHYGKNAVAILDQLNSGDILAASSSGNIRFVITNNGDIGLYGTNPSITNTGANTLTLNSGSTGNLQFFSSSNSLTSAGALTLASNLTVNGNTISLGNGASSVIQTSNANLQFAAGSGTISLNTAANGPVTTGTGLTTLGGSVQVNGSTITFNNAAATITTGTNQTINISPNGTGKVVLGTSTNGLTFDPAAGPTYNGTAQPVKKITLSPEYAGATLTAFNGASTETNITGSLTSDTDTATDAKNFYSWTATSGTQQFYVVAVRVTLPQDFSSWPSSNAVVINYVTQSTTGTNSSVQARIYNDSRTSVYAGSAIASSIAGTWTSTSIGSASLTNWNTAGATAVIYLDMGSASSNYSRIGDIVLTYNSKF